MMGVYDDERPFDYPGSLQGEPPASPDVHVNFGTMGADEDPDEYDRLRDLGYFDDYRYSGKEPWQ